MKIGIHTYEPGITHKQLVNSTGGRDWLKFVINMLQSRGHEVFWVSNKLFPAWPSNKTLKTTKLDGLDTIFMPWRWPMPKYPERHALYEQQQEILANYKGRIIVHDEDHMITAKEEQHLMTSPNVVLTAPELLPRPGYKTLIFPYPFAGLPTPDMIEDKFTKLPNERKKMVDFVYVGNNYERYNQTKLFLSTKHTRGLDPELKVQIWGNWLEKHSDRETPEQVKTDFPNVLFQGRLPQNQVRDVLQNAYATVALHKPSYGHSGFVTIRWAEAIAASCILFIPQTFKMPRAFASLFMADGLVVANGDEMSDSFHDIMNSKYRFVGTLLRQQNMVFQHMDDRPWYKLLEGEK